MRLSLSSSGSSVSTKTKSNRESNGADIFKFSRTLFDRSYRPLCGFAAAKMVVRAGKDALAPPLFTETLCCSMASSKLACSDFILSNSSTQQTPPCANATAPASNVGAPDVGSRDTVAVKPAVEADLPLTCIANGATREAARSICDLPMPGSPTTRQCEVPRAKVSFPAAPWFLCWCCSRAFNELLRRL